MHLMMAWGWGQLDEIYNGEVNKSNDEIFLVESLFFLMVYSDKTVEVFLDLLSLHHSDS